MQSVLYFTYFIYMDGYMVNTNPNTFCSNAYTELYHMYYYMVKTISSCTSLLCILTNTITIVFTTDQKL